MSFLGDPNEGCSSFKFPFKTTKEGVPSEKTQIQCRVYRGFNKCSLACFSISQTTSSRATQAGSRSPEVYARTHARLSMTACFMSTWVRLILLVPLFVVVKGIPKGTKKSSFFWGRRNKTERASRLIKAETQYRTCRSVLLANVGQAFLVKLSRPPTPSNNARRPGICQTASPKEGSGIEYMNSCTCFCRWLVCNQPANMKPIEGLKDGVPFEGTSWQISCWKGCCDV